MSLIGAERLEMPDGPLRDVLTRIYADEVGHARFGWRIVNEEVPKLSADARGRLGLYLRVAFAHLERHELAHLPENVCPPPEGAALGLCSGPRRTRPLLRDARRGHRSAVEAAGLEAGRAYRTRSLT